MTDDEVILRVICREFPSGATELATLRSRCEAAEAEVLRWKESHAANVDTILSHAALILHHKARSERLAEALDSAVGVLGDAHYWFKRAAGGPCADFTMECKLSGSVAAALAALAKEKP